MLSPARCPSFTEPGALAGATPAIVQPRSAADFLWHGSTIAGLLANRNCLPTTIGLGMKSFPDTSSLDVPPPLPTPV